MKAEDDVDDDAHGSTCVILWYKHAMPIYILCLEMLSDALRYSLLFVYYCLEQNINLSHESL